MFTFIDVTRSIKVEKKVISGEITFFFKKNDVIFKVIFNNKKTRVKEVKFKDFKIVAIRK